MPSLPPPCPVPHGAHMTSSVSSPIYEIISKLTMIPLVQGPPIPLYEPVEDGTKDNIIISKSYDATSHFETTTDDVKDIFRRCMGQELVVEGLREGIQVAPE